MLPAHGCLFARYQVEFCLLKSASVSCIPKDAPADADGEYPCWDHCAESLKLDIGFDHGCVRCSCSLPFSPSLPGCNRVRVLFELLLRSSLCLVCMIALSSLPDTSLSLGLLGLQVQGDLQREHSGVHLPPRGGV